MFLRLSGTGFAVYSLNKILYFRVRRQEFNYGKNNWNRFGNNDVGRGHYGRFGPEGAYQLVGCAADTLGGRLYG